MRSGTWVGHDLPSGWSSGLTRVMGYGIRLNRTVSYLRQPSSAQIPFCEHATISVNRRRLLVVVCSIVYLTPIRSSCEFEDFLHDARSQFSKKVLTRS
jgi:hypothetical protein